MTYYLGIDAGGTKTLALIADAEGQVLGVGRAGTGNWESVGLEGAFQAYVDAVAAALQAAGIRREEIAAAGYALAGMDWPSDEGRLTPLIARLELPGPYMLVNDTFAALRAGATDDVGVAVICGTGSTIAGRNRAGRMFRTFGLGALWGEHQGASGLVLAAFRALGRSYFGSGPPTTLEARLLAACGAGSVPELAERISRGESDWPGGRLAPLVLAEADAGDAVARAIVQEAGAELGLNAAAVARRLELAAEPFALVMAGGVLASGNPLLVEALVEPVRAYAPFVEPVVLAAPPAVGAVLLAMDAAGVPVTSGACARLEREAAAAMRGAGTGDADE
jgi:N-acetylglucosamine kinase-like BadF-type ATPase